MRVGQLAALYSERHRVYITFHHVHMHMAFNALGEVLTILITLDELIKQNPSFRGSFGPFKRCVCTNTTVIPFWKGPNA